MNEERLKTLKEVAEQLDRPPHRIIHVCETGLVRPTVEADGRGTVRRFSREEVFRILLALELQEAGVQAPLIKPLMKALDYFLNIPEVGIAAMKLDPSDLLAAISELSSPQEPMRAFLIAPRRVALVLPRPGDLSHSGSPLELHRNDLKLVPTGVAIVINLTVLAGRF